MSTIDVSSNRHRNVEDHDPLAEPETRNCGFSLRCGVFPRVFAGGMGCNE